MALELLDAVARLSELRGPKILIAGPTAIGKTSLLKTFLPELLSTTLLVDLEAGDLPVADLAITSVRPRTWEDCKDIACAIGGPDPARAPGAPYSQGHYHTIIADPTFASLAQFNIIFVDSYTELARRCRAWAEQQPESFNAYGKKDLRGAYGLVGRELIAWTQQLQHARARTIILVTILEKIVDERGSPTWQIQLEGQRTRRELPAILDVIVTMTWVTFKDGNARRAFVCDPANSWGYPAKDRSGRLAQIEEPNLEKLLAKLSTQQT
jgi:hypothetical protein